MRFRRPDGRSANLTLGRVSDVEVEGEPVMGSYLTLASARKLAAEVQRQRALGRDPAADRQTQVARRSSQSATPSQH